MTDEQPPTPLEDLDARLREASDRRQGRKVASDRFGRGSALSLALRIGVELVASLIVGVGIGLLLDKWLGTTPWLLLLFFLLGSAAGMMSVFRVVGGHGVAVGYRKGEAASSPEERDDGKG
jgi:ATP synthase protein I